VRAVTSGHPAILRGLRLVVQLPRQLASLVVAFRGNQGFLPRHRSPFVPKWRTVEGSTEERRLTCPARGKALGPGSTSLDHE
jgi:hypothetical protein